MQERYQRDGWLLDAAAIYCGAVPSLARHRQQAGSTLFLRAERQSDGRRNYKLAVKDPLPTSYGEDLYYRLGGWLEEDRTPTSAAAAATGR